MTNREIAEKHYDKYPDNEFDRVYRNNRINALEKLLNKERPEAAQQETVVMLPELKELLDFILTKSTFQNSKDSNAKEHTICLALKVRDRIAT